MSFKLRGTLGRSRTAPGVRQVLAARTLGVFGGLLVGWLLAASALEAAGEIPIRLRYDHALELGASVPGVVAEGVTAVWGVEIESGHFVHIVVHQLGQP